MKRFVGILFFLGGKWGVLLRDQKYQKSAKEGLFVRPLQTSAHLRERAAECESFGGTTKSFVHLCKGGAVKGAEPLSHSKEGESSFSAFLFCSFFFAPALPKKKRAEVFAVSDGGRQKPRHAKAAA